MNLGTLAIGLGSLWLGACSGKYAASEADGSSEGATTSTDAGGGTAAGSTASGGTEGAVTNSTGSGGATAESTAATDGTTAAGGQAGAAATPTGWSEPVRLPTAGSVSEAPRVVMDADGRATVVWPATESDGFSIQATHYESDDWSSVQTVIHTDVRVAPVVALDGEGVVTVGWVESDGDQAYPWASRSEAANDWSPPESIADVAAETSLGLASDQSSAVIAVWEVATPRSLWSARYVSGSGWTQASAIHDLDDVLEPVSPRLVGAYGGGAIATWSQTTTDEQGYFSILHDVDDSWGAPESFTSVTLPVPTSMGRQVYDYAVAIGEDGSAVVAWDETTHPTTTSQIRRYSPTSGWTDGTSVPGTSAPRVSVDGFGSATIVGLGNAFAGTSGCWAVRYEAKMTEWENPTHFAIDRDGVDHCGSEGYDLSVASGSGGTTVAAWMLRPSGSLSGEIWVNRYEPDSGWGEPSMVSTIQTTCSSCSSELAIAVDPVGNAILVWRGHDGAHFVGASVYRATE